MPTAPTSLAAELASFRAEVEASLQRLTPRDTAKGILLKGYLEAYRKQGGEGLYQRCLDLVGEKRLVDFLSYPYAHILKVGLLGAEELAEKMGGVAPYLRAMGRIAVEEYLGSALGKTFLAMVHPTPRAMLSPLPVAIRTLLSFGERSLVVVSPSEVRLECRGDYSPPEANAGAIEAIVKATNALEVDVQVRRLGGLDYDITAKWKA